ncbi:MAG: M20 family peptidase [Bacteroidales bacterium]
MALYQERSISMKKFIHFIHWLVGLLVIIIVIKTLFFKSLQEYYDGAPAVDFGEESVTNLSEAVKFPTVSYSPDSPVDSIAFQGYVQFIKRRYPLIDSLLNVQIFNRFSLLYRWDGRNDTLAPVVLMAHYDVVPAGDTAGWEKNPFSGFNDGIYIWGRGTLDDKSAMVSILEAVERLLSEGFIPERTIYLSFGHDEEIGGEKGTKTIVSFLKEKGIKPEYVLDEGMAVTIGMVPMMEKPVALIGTSEKGYLSGKLSAEMPGGHSSIPEKESALVLIAKAVSSLSVKQMKTRLSGPVNDFIRYIGREMPFYARVIFANKWLFKPLLLSIYSGSASGNALVRTTTAPTIIESGVKDNVIPTKAEAVVNFRILPGETSEDVLNHIEKVINDQRVIIEPLKDFMNEPAPFSPSDAPGFKKVFRTIRQVYPEAVVAPTLTLSASDSRYFAAITGNIYRFAPLIITSEDMARVHGLNERIKIEDYLRGIRFYYMLLKNSQ